MTIAEDIARMELATLLDYRDSYERATRREQPGTLHSIYAHTLELINEQIARKLPIVPLLPSEEPTPF